MVAKHGRCLDRMQRSVGVGDDFHIWTDKELYDLVNGADIVQPFSIKWLLYLAHIVKMENNISARPVKRRSYRWWKSQMVNIFSSFGITNLMTRAQSKRAWKEELRQAEIRHMRY